MRRLRFEPDFKHFKQTQIMSVLSDLRYLDELGPKKMCYYIVLTILSVLFLVKDEI